MIKLIQNLLYKLANLKNALLLVLVLAVYDIAVYKFATLEGINDYNIFFAYSVIAFLFLISKYVMASAHRPTRYNNKIEDWPTVSVIVPAYNEGEAIYNTVKALALSYYPRSKMEIIVVNDGSTDNTQDYIDSSVRDFDGFYKITKINRGVNRGKRECMYDGFQQSDSEFVVFIDSDSIVDRQCIKELIRPFYKDKNIAGVSGHAYVSNADKNWLTQMQEVRYFNAFKAYKASESLMGYVTCCSGCCSSYRRSAMDEVLEKWIKQSFLGNICTYGDDRSLTNFLLKHDYKSVYNERAISYTNVPETYRQYVKQQLRWKKSWLRESWVTFSYMGTKSYAFIMLNLLNIALPLFSPFIIARYFVWYVAVDYTVTIGYLIGMLITAFLIGIYYKSNNQDKDHPWFFGSLYFQLVNISLFWQIPYALVTLRDTSWGTR